MSPVVSMQMCIRDRSKKNKSDKKDTFDREKLAAAGCPDTLLDLAERNPETIDFVKGYLDYNSASVNRDISAEVQQGTIPLFLQWDKRWGYEQYGLSLIHIQMCIRDSLGKQLLGMFSVIAWTVVTITITFMIIKATVGPVSYTHLQAQSLSSLSCS